MVEKNEELLSPKTCETLLNEYRELVAFEGGYPPRTLINVDMDQLKELHSQSAPYTDASTKSPVSTSKLICYNPLDPFGKYEYLSRAASEESQTETFTV